MLQPDWLILRSLQQSFEIERPKGHWSDVVVHLYIQVYSSKAFRLTDFGKEMSMGVSFLRTAQSLLTGRAINLC